MTIDPQAAVRAGEPNDLLNERPWRVNSDGWGDVWIETATGRVIGSVHPKIDANELNEALAALSTPGDAQASGEPGLNYVQSPECLAEIEAIEGQNVANASGLRDFIIAIGPNRVEVVLAEGQTLFVRNPAPPAPAES